MTATFTTEPRLAENPGHRPPREIPILFHLMDVSSPKGMGKPAAHRQEEPPPEPAEVPAAIAELEVSSVGPTSPEVGEPIATRTETRAVPGTEYLVPSTPDSSSIGVPEPEALESHTSTAAEQQSTPPAAEPPTVSPRERAEQRRRERHVSTQASWFATQGKYIAIAFALALVATVYIARTNKRPAKPAATPHAHPGAPHREKHGTGKTELVIEMPAKGGKTATASNAKAKPAAAKTAQPAAKSTAEVELHPPQLKVPQLAETKPAGKPSDAGLFPWGQQAEERVATRPEAPSLTVPAGPPQPQAPEPALAQPTIVQSYGAPPAGVSAPALGGPPAMGPVPAEQPYYPTTSYRSEFQPAAPGPAGIGPVGPVNPGMPAGQPADGGAYYPTTNSASGYRYERTGSGLY